MCGYSETIPMALSKFYFMIEKPILDDVTFNTLFWLTCLNAEMKLRGNNLLLDFHFKCDLTITVYSFDCAIVPSHL